MFLLRLVIAVGIVCGVHFGIELYENSYLEAKVINSLEQFSKSGIDDRTELIVRDKTYAVLMFLAISAAAAVLADDVKKVWKQLFILLIFTSIGCRTFEPIKLETIQTNEEGFLIPLVGNIDNQVHTDNLEQLKKNIISAKQVQIPQQWVKTGRDWFGVPNGEWRDAALLIQVDKSPVTREWTADENSGSSNKNEAIWVMTADQVEFSTGWVCTASIVSSDDAVKFLHTYRNRALQSVMDTEIRARVQTTWGGEVTDLPMDQLRKAATPHLKTVIKDVTDYFSERGITISNLGISGGFVYKDKSIMTKLVEVFNAEQARAIAIADAAAQEERNKSVKSTAEGKAEALEIEKTAEANGITLVAKALKDAASGPEYLAAKALDIQLKLIERWDGKYPTSFMGGSNPVSLLLSPTGQ